MSHIITSIHFSSVCHYFRSSITSPARLSLSCCSWKTQNYTAAVWDQVGGHQTARRGYLLRKTASRTKPYPFHPQVSTCPRINKELMLTLLEAQWSKWRKMTVEGLITPTAASNNTSCCPVGDLIWSRKSFNYCKCSFCCCRTTYSHSLFFLSVYISVSGLVSASSAVRLAL